ncbi:hypothetical protein H4S01_003311, partial [Coemansia sp. RSA 2610]
MSPAGSANENGDNASPKRFKGNDHSSLPASILKEGPSDEEQSDERSERRKSRKSLGRRVSFAPTAHVRMFEIPEEKQQQRASGNNMYQMPDLSSQTGMLGFNLGTIPAAEETSMNSNESFDVSVRHSDPSDSLQSSEGSFAADTAQVDAQALSASEVAGGNHESEYGNILDDDDDGDDDDDDDDIEDEDGDDDAVTMELTGTVDMGAIENDDGSDDSDEPGNYAAAEDLANELTNPNTRTVDAESFLNMLMQSGSSAEQQTSLLDNIMSQFGQGQLLVGADSTAHSALDAEVTRVGTMAADDEQDTTIHMNAAAEAADESDDSDDAASNENDDAVTMELTGIVPRQHEGDDDEDDNGSENSAGER